MTTLTVADHLTPLGTVRMVVRGDALCALGFVERWAPLERALRRRFGADVPAPGRTPRRPARVAGALDDYFAGVVGALDALRGRSRRHALPARGVDSAPRHPGGHDRVLRRTRARDRPCRRRPRRRRGERRQPDLAGAPLPSRHRRRRLAHRLRLRSRAEALAAHARGRRRAIQISSHGQLRAHSSVTNG